MTLWPFRRRATPTASLEALEHIDQGSRDLAEARKLRQESHRVGTALRVTQEENHIAAALALAITGRKTA